MRRTAVYNDRPFSFGQQQTKNSSYPSWTEAGDRMTLFYHLRFFLSLSGPTERTFPTGYRSQAARISFDGEKDKWKTISFVLLASRARPKWKRKRRADIGCHYVIRQQRGNRLLFSNRIICRDQSYKAIMTQLEFLLTAARWYSRARKNIPVIRW